ncbi:hypothetical protein JQC92_04610 [Shewanella sp. 202IG2-18]|uniref:hypothetical protein n=1 Tax=Parashewanella hymeniacidonis TaxID=2807618 RepID=UPI0019610101|nr:hypothetical protein [Parashewanella hymeniacidonis]MBM7071324.1 hypothetical protein [Parashewanella hymeniacidonis]
MKKAAIALAVVAAGAAGYWYTQNSSSTASDSVYLEYIPADTLMFSGSLEDFPLKDYINHTAASMMPMDTSAFDNLGEKESTHTKFLLSLLKQFQQAVTKPETFTQSYGLPDSGKSFMYTIGAMPVIKVELASPDAFWKHLDSAEKDSGFNHQIKELDGVIYRAYQLMDKDVNGKPMDLIFTEKDGVLTITLTGFTQDNSALKQAFSLVKPKHSLAKSGQLEQIIDKYDFDPRSVFYINQKALVKGITTTDGNEFAQQLTSMFALAGENPLSEFQTPECAQELQGIADNWPRTVAGLTALDILPDHAKMDVSVIAESNNKTMIDGLKKLRGFIPNFVANDKDSVMAMGLALNTSDVVSGLTDVWSDLQTPAYQCEPLAQMQQKLSQQSPAMLGMATGMAAGLKGIAASIIDLEFDGTQGPSISQLDALVSVSADKPEQLFNKLKTFVPMLANVELKPNGEAVDLSTLLPIPPQLNIKPMLALKGQHLVLYTDVKGEKLADNLSNEAVTENGIISMAIDQGKLMKHLIKASELSGQPMPKELNMMKGNNQFKFSFDVQDDGIVIKESIVYKK